MPRQWSQRALTPAGLLSKFLRPLEIPVTDSAASPRLEDPVAPAPPAESAPPSPVPTVADATAPSRHLGARVEVKKLGKAYIHGGAALPVLWDIDLTLEPGDMVAVVGASGVGKSTLLQILGTLDLPTSGSIKFDGEELTRMGASRLADFRNRKIGFVFQFHHLLPEFTAVENAEMPMRIARLAVSDARQRAGELLRRVGLGERLTHRPGMLSGGEQQRVAVARALIMRPSVLLADEPTGDLDEQTADALHALLREMHAAYGLTSIIATHNPRLAAACDRILRLEGGRLAAA